jgi:hypothetical protein
LVQDVDATGLPMQVTQRVLNVLIPTVENRLANPLGA